MSVCVPAEEDSASEEAGPTRETHEQKSVSKVVRVLTVLAYLLSVSLAAILLSVYYICVWKSPELPPLNKTEPELSARKGDYHQYSPQHAHHTADSDEFRRSNSTMNSTMEAPLTTPPVGLEAGAPVEPPPTAGTPAPRTTAPAAYNATDNTPPLNATNNT